MSEGRWETVGRVKCAVGRPAHNGVGRRVRLGQLSLPTTGNGETAGAHQMCHSTKRTHRFLAGFFMEMAMNKRLTVEISERNRWVRFGKRTHRKGFLGSVSSKSGVVWRRNTDLHRWTWTMWTRWTDMDEAMHSGGARAKHADRAAWLQEENRRRGPRSAPAATTARAWRR
jgi:hypothetical protein